MEWLNSRKWIYLMFVVLGVSRLTNAQKQHKRQIYREQVLPALGGKIPEEAFRTDRLALNRLNKDGITVIEGVLLESRDHEKNPDNVRSKPEVIQVYVTEDSRYVPPEGRYHNDRPKTIDTTYVIRKPVGNHEGARTRLNGIAALTTMQRGHNRPVNNNGNRGHIHSDNNISGYRRIEASSTTPKSPQNRPNAHGYANFHRYVPTIPNNRLFQQQHQQHYRTIYKPIITPLVIPAPEIIFSKPNNNYNNFERLPSFDLQYDWNRFYQPSAAQSLFLEDNGDLFFDPHEIITNYEGFFNTFHGRNYRHIGSPNEKSGSGEHFSRESRNKGAGQNAFSTDRERKSTFGDEKLDRQISTSVSTTKSLPSYTDLTKIPETTFSCSGRKGTFPDVETKCQVFHECSGWSKVSSLCPVGTAYSSEKKRCDWWNTVTCDSG